MHHTPCDLRRWIQICGQRTPGADHAAFLALQETVAEALPREQILTPGDVRGDYPTLADAVQGRFNLHGGDDEKMALLKGGWPKVDDTRGMMLFVLDYQSVNIECRDGIREVCQCVRLIVQTDTPVCRVHSWHLRCVCVLAPVLWGCAEHLIWWMLRDSLSRGSSESNSKLLLGPCLLPPC